MTSEYRIAFKAGRAFRRERTNFVDADATKGAIVLQNGDDGLLHFVWKDRGTGAVQEDLILFPGDASFVKVPQSSWGRTYVLKFSSSNQIHFFWMQDADASRDAEFVENVNRLLQDPESVPIWHAEQAEAGPSTSTAASTSAPVAGSSTSADQPAAGSSNQPTPEQIAHLRQILGRAGATPAVPNRPDYLLQDMLTPTALLPLFTTHPTLIPALFPFLPSDLPVPPSAEALQQVVASAPFRAAVRSFDAALASGGLGGLVRALGLPEEAGTGWEAFLNAIAEQARRQQESGEGAEHGHDTMDTD